MTVKNISSIVYNEDCIDGMKLFPDNHFDLAIVDPPYGIDYQSTRQIDKTQWKPKIANDKTPFISWIEPLFSKLKNSGRLICFYRWDVQNHFLNEINRVGFNVKSQLIWDKIVHGMGDLKGEFSPQHECAIYAIKGRFEFMANRPTSIYRKQRCNAEKMIHPNEKPIALYGSLLNDIGAGGG